MKNWRKLAALCLAGIMVFALVACTQEEENTPDKTEPQGTTDNTPSAPTGEGESVNNGLLVIDPETYKEFIGTWYADGSSASYRINVKDDSTWELTDAAGEVACSGSLRMNEEEELLEMYDPDGSLAITIAMEEDGVIHADIMVESLTDTLSTNYFYNKITNDISDAPPVDVEDSSGDLGVENDVIVAPPADEDISG